MTTERERPDVVNEIWSELRRRVKPILAKLKEKYKKEAEQNVFLDGIKHLITQILGQNVSNINKYKENMTTLVQSIKDTFTKDEAGVPTAKVKLVFLLLVLVLRRQSSKNRQRCLYGIRICL